MAIHEDLVCYKTGSKFDTNRNTDLDICIYHLKRREYRMTGTNTVSKYDLTTWLMENLICKSARNHVYFLINNRL